MTRCLLFACLLWLWSGIASAQITFDAAAYGSYTNSDTTWSFQHTVGSGSNRVLVACTLSDGGASSKVTSVTYNGVAMTRVTGIEVPSDRWVDLFYLVGPTSGANSVSINTSSSSFIMGAAASYANVTPTTGPEAQNTTTTASDTSHTNSVTTVTSNAWVVMCVKSYQPGIAPGTPTPTERATDGVDFDTFAIGDTNAAIDPPGSTSLQWTTGMAGAWGSIIVALTPASASITGNSLMLRGIGR